MALRFYLAVLLISVALCSASKSTRIVGGDTTRIENYPSLVQVESSTTIFWRQSCAGTILTSRFVLSAAQCFRGTFFSISNRRIRAGTGNRNRGGVVIGLTRVFNHPTYNHSTKDGDLTILELSSQFAFSPRIQPSAILSQGFDIPDNLPVIQAGWGSTSLNGGGSSSVLRDVEVFTVSHQFCVDSYTSLGRPQIVTHNMLCTGVMGEGRDACTGDEGGPVYYDNIVIGIISWRHGCGNGTVPSVNTRISSYTNWIVINAS